MPETTTSEARRRIMERLRHRAPRPAPASSFGIIEERRWDPAQRLERFTRLIAGANAEVHRVGREGWVARLREILDAAGVARVACGADVPALSGLAEAWGGGPELVTCAGVEGSALKDLLFGIDAGLTSVRGAIADTGSLVLWPDAAEPRMLSLVPPVHVALLDARDIHDTLLSMLRAEDWAAGMPTNALLVSGPSKTADIEQTLVYGVHGPSRLIVVVLEEGR